jgi:hypothetical protein
MDKNYIRSLYSTDKLKISAHATHTLHDPEAYVGLSGNNIPTTYQKIKSKTLIGLAHNQIEYYFKEKQGCDIVMLSPLFFNKKYSTNEILGTTRFNLITKNWKTKVGALEV